MSFFMDFLQNANNVNFALPAEVTLSFHANYWQLLLISYKKIFLTVKNLCEMTMLGRGWGFKCSQNPGIAINKGEDLSTKHFLLTLTKGNRKELHNTNIVCQDKEEEGWTMKRSKRVEVQNMSTKGDHHT